MPDRFAATEMTYTAMSSDISYELLIVISLLCQLVFPMIFRLSPAAPCGAVLPEGQGRTSLSEGLQAPTWPCCSVLAARSPRRWPAARQGFRPYAGHPGLRRGTPDRWGCQAGS